MKKVLLRAPLLSKSGYGVHCRQVFRYLLNKKDIDLKVQILSWGITPWYLKEEDLGGLVGEIIKKSDVPPGYKFDVTVQVQLPNEWDPSLGKFNVGITAGVETDTANPAWPNTYCQNMDMVIVPSQHSKNSLLKKSSTSTPVHVVPESYYDEVIDDPSEILDLKLKSDFNFLTVGVLTGMTPETDRKNLMYQIKWFVENFRGNSDVGLVIKTNRGRETSIDRRGTTMMLRRLLREINYDGTPNIYFLHGSMSNEEMTQLYKHPKIKALVSLTRGEGFGLPLLEAAVAGLPVIATNWSSHKEFLDLGKWIKVDYDLVEISPDRVDGQIFMKNAKWAFPREDDFKKKITTFYEKPQKPKEWAQKLSEKLTKKYSQASIEEFYDQVLGEFLR